MYHVETGMRNFAHNLEPKGLLLVAVIALFGLNIFLLQLLQDKHSHVLKVVFLDVGQGDAILVETPNKHRILIDAGPSGPKLMRALSKELYFWQKDFDMALATHADKDHVAGFLDFLKVYKVDFVRTPYALDKKVAEFTDSLLLSLAKAKQKGAQELSLHRGSVIDFDDGVELIVYAPPESVPFHDTNSSSLTLKLVYGKTSFLLTGDLPDGMEKVLAMYDADKLRANVLKLGHHGSRNSSSLEFLATVRPEIVVVSAGLNNRYGHPHKKTMERVKSIGARVFRTDQQGNLRFISDGEQIVVTTEK